MRTLVIAALATFVVAGVGFVFARDLPAPEGPLAPAADSAEQSLAANGDEARADETPVASALPAKPVYYQWVDAKGTVRFARSLAEVPPAWRERAGQIAMSSDDMIRPAQPARGARTRSRAAYSEPEPASNASHDITIYTAPWCGWCRKTIAFLDERGVDYVNKDIDADPDHKDELREKSGGTSIPFVEIDDTQIRGYDPGQMAALLE